MATTLIAALDHEGGSLVDAARPVFHARHLEKTEWGRAMGWSRTERSAATCVMSSRPRNTKGTDVSTGDWSTFVVKAGRVERRTVKIGHVGGASAEVLTGIEPG